MHPLTETNRLIINPFRESNQTMKKRLYRIKYFLTFLIILFVSLDTSHITAAASNVKSGTASVMRLEKTIGDISVTSSAGSKTQIIEKMRLNSGDDVESLSSSYAYISLDDSKVVKLDEKSGASVNKNKKKYEMVLEYGNMFFDVDKPLESNEGFEIKSATMTMGIRGTCAQIEKKSENVTSVSLFEGTLSCIVVDPLTGNAQTIYLHAGDHADFCTGDGYMNRVQIITRRIVYEDIRGFVLEYILEKPGLAQRIYEQTGIDLRFLTKQQADAELAFDEAGGVRNVAAGRMSPSANWYSTGH